MYISKKIVATSISLSQQKTCFVATKMIPVADALYQRYCS